MFSLFHWTQAFFFFLFSFFSMKNEVYWDLRGSSVFWLYNIQEIKSNFMRDGHRSVCRVWPTWETASVFMSWPTRFLKGPSEDMAWGFDLYEPLFICLFNSQLIITLSLKSLHSSFGDSDSERSDSLRKACGLGKDLPDMAGREMALSVCLFVPFGFSIKSHTDTKPSRETTSWPSG